MKTISGDKTMQLNNELASLVKVLSVLRAEGRILLAILFGSYANGAPHVRSDIDLLCVR